MENQVVIFELDEECYGVNIAAVESIIKMQPITRMPHAPDYVEGVTNLRGKIIPVLDLQRRFNLQAQDISRDSRIIVVSLSGSEIGMVVNAVTEVITISDEDIDPAPPIAATVDSAFITGIAKVNGRLVILLDLGMVLSAQEQSAVEAMKTLS